MASYRLDALDKKIIRALARDGRLSASELAERLDVTPPTIRSRIKSLQESGSFKICGLLDTFYHQEFTVALIGLNVRSYGRLDEVLNKVAELENVTWASVVTGRYDILAEVVFIGGTATLYRITAGMIPQVGEVLSSESFVIMKSVNKWTCLPQDFDDW